MQSPSVLFDLDGTLLSTSADLLTSLNHVLELSDLGPVTFDDMTWLVGQGGRVMIARACAMTGRSITEDELTSMNTAFIEHYEAAMPGETKPFPGLITALDRLEAEGMKLAVCTNKLERLAVRLLDGLGLTGRFCAITGGDSFANRKPHRDHILMTIARAGGDPAQAVMIGDSVNDILAARNAGIPSIGVPFGYSDKPVQELGPDHVIEHFDELDGDLVRSLLARQKTDAGIALS